MTAQQDEWRIGRRGGRCAACDTAFAPGIEAVSALYAGEGAFTRSDFCVACFQDAAKRGSPFSWWSAPVPEPEAKKAVFDLGVAREFLMRLLAENDPAQASLRYLLVLMLMRKRAVHLQGQTTDARGEVMAITVPPDDDTTYEVVAAEIDEAEAERLREQLGRLFQLA